MDKPNWESVTVKADDLKPFEHNPRCITDLELDRLSESINTTGYHAPIIIDADNTIIAGHQRWQILKKLGYTKVDVRKPDRKLTDDEFKQINIQDNLNFGDWDRDILIEHFDIDDLVKWDPGFEVMLSPSSDSTESETQPTESYRFVVDCEDIDQLEDLKRRYKAKDDKITYDQFIHYS